MWRLLLTAAALSSFSFPSSPSAAAAATPPPPPLPPHRSVESHHCQANNVTCRCELHPAREVRTLACPDHWVVDRIHFASFGVPRGSCADHAFVFLQEGGCHSEASRTAAGDLCLNRTSCRLSGGVFGPPTGASCGVGGGAGGGAGGGHAAATSAGSAGSAGSASMPAAPAGHGSSEHLYWAVIYSCAPEALCGASCPSRRPPFVGGRGVWDSRGARRVGENGGGNGGGNGDGNGDGGREEGRRAAAEVAGASHGKDGGPGAGAGAHRGGGVAIQRQGDVNKRPTAASTAGKQTLALAQHGDDSSLPDTLRERSSSSSFFGGLPAVPSLTIYDDFALPPTSTKMAKRCKNRRQKLKQWRSTRGKVPGAVCDGIKCHPPTPGADDEDGGSEPLQIGSAGQAAGGGGPARQSGQDGAAKKKKRPSGPRL